MFLIDSSTLLDYRFDFVAILLKLTYALRAFFGYLNSSVVMIFFTLTSCAIKLSETFAILSIADEESTVIARAHITSSKFLLV